MKSRSARWILWAGLALLGFCVLSTLISYPILEWGGCSQGRFPMGAGVTQRPVECAALPNWLGEYFDLWATSWIFVAIIFLPIFLGIWVVLIALTEIAVRRELARQARARDSRGE
ncbi:MAG: hypothetical protein AAFN09_09780 [Pseudomonadota bacterium]